MQARKKYLADVKPSGRRYSSPVGMLIGEHTIAARQLTREKRKLKSALKALTKTCGEALRAIDHEMSQPSTPERGRRIASICNALEMANDHARYFALGVNYRTDVKNLRPTK